MNQGAIVEIANSDDIYRNPQHPYTKKLLSSIPKGWHDRPAYVVTGAYSYKVNAISLTTAPGRRMLLTLRAR